MQVTTLSIKETQCQSTTLKVKGEAINV